MKPRTRTHLRPAELNYKAMFEGSAAVMLLIDPLSKKIVDANAAACRFYGYTRESMQKFSITDINTAASEKIAADLRNASNQRQDYFQAHHRLASGDIRDVEIYSGPISAHRKQLLLSIIHDITERNRVQEKLRLSEEKYSKAFHLSPDSVNLNRLADGVFLEISEGFTKVTGYTAEDVIGRSSLPGELGLWVSKADRDRMVEGLKTFGEVVGLEAAFRCKDGRVLTGLMSAKIIRVNNEDCILSLTRDITERKHMERRLQESEERYREFIERMPDGVYKSTHEGRFLEVNPAMVEILGYESKQDLLSIDIKSQLYFDVRDRESAALEEKLEEMAVFRLRKQNGAEVWVEDHGRHITDEQGNVLYHEGILRDVSERVRADAELRRSEARFRSYFELPLVGIAISAPDKTWIEVNDRLCEMLGYSREELTHKTWAEMTHPEDVESNTRLFNEVLAGSRDGYMLDKRFIRKNGEILWVSLAVSCVRQESGAVDHFMSTFQDITERKRSEQLILTSLHEKELLLKEIHHRVKNNMQVISSLLSLQSRESQDPNIRDGFIESQNRVRSMALVHEKLYRSGDMANIEFGEYLNSVTDQLAKMATATGIECRVRADNVLLGIDTAIPCGLIANELITNALKHAFPGREQGVVTVGLRRVDKAKVELTVEDDGVGFPEQSDFRQMHSMGMTIVVSLVSQISGTVSLQSERGTRFVVTFPG